MCVKVYANGTGSGTSSHLSASLCVLPGLYDKNLKWPFEGKIKLSVLNQSEDDHHSVASFNVKQCHNLISGRCYCDETFMPHVNIFNDQYQRLCLKNDTLYFQVNVT